MAPSGRGCVKTPHHNDNEHYRFVARRRDKSFPIGAKVRLADWRAAFIEDRVFTRPRWKADCLLRQNVLLHRLVVTLTLV